LDNNIYSDPFSGKEAAIMRLGGMKELYIKYLKKFKTGYSDSDEVLNHLIKVEKYDDARVFAHSIKGLAATLGLDPLSIRSQAIESAIIEGRYSDLPLLICYFKNSLQQVIQSKEDQSSSSVGT
jgi:two-component system sensor histidine kinase/response regulator